MNGKSPTRNDRDLADPQPAQYYCESGRSSPWGIVVALLIGVPWAIAVGWGYGWVAARVLYLKPVALIAFAVVAAFIPAMASMRGAIRNTAVSLALTGTILLAGYYTSWASWAHGVVQQSQTPPTYGVVDLMLHPAALWNLITEINSEGTWSVGTVSRGQPNLGEKHGKEHYYGTNVRGGVLTTLWVVEVLVVAIAWLWTSLAFRRISVFCESCGSWCDPPKIFAKVFGIPPGNFKERLELLRDVEALGGWPASGEQDRWYEFSHQCCASCGKLNLLIVEEVRRIPAAYGTTQDLRRAVVPRLMLTAQEVAAAEAVARSSGYARM